MKKLIVVCMNLMLFISLCSCSNQSTTIQSTIPSSVTHDDILIAYFTWADNTIVEDEQQALNSALSHYESMGDDISEVDALSSASILSPGNSARIAQWIQEEVGGDLFSIQTKEKYPSDYESCLEKASNELANNDRQILSTHVENMDSYSTIFLGFPNWWYTIPMAVHSFIEEYDLEGKTIIPFVTHGTGGLSRTIQDLQNALPDNTTVLEPIGISRSDILDSKSTIQSWLQQLGFTTQTKEENITMQETNTIQITTTDFTILVELEDNSATQDLIQRLPLTLTFEDFNGTEKISYLDSELDISNAPNSCTPKQGDLTYYAPWGNLAFFYHDFRQSSQLIPLGTIIEGEEYLQQLDTVESVTIELYKS